MNLSRISRYPAPVRIVVFVAILAVIWLPLAAPLYWFSSRFSWSEIVIVILLYFEFIGLVAFWGRQVHRQSRPLHYYGLIFNQNSLWRLLAGLCLGFASVFLLFGLESLPGWVTWESASGSFWRIMIEGGLVALGIGFAEELLFRGWLLGELKQDYLAQQTLWASSLIFATLHFLKPPEEILRTWPQFPGLVLLGLTLVFGKFILWSDRTKSSVLPLQTKTWNGNLGFPIGLHTGLVWGYYLINVGNLITYTGQVPDWITGIDRNPLAGIAGLATLGMIALNVKKYSQFG
ncbi:MAG: CPBP family intramembrane glutamic endopeptidase [Microcoleaceae cyanobacterium]